VKIASQVQTVGPAGAKTSASDGREGDCCDQWVNFSSEFSDSGVWLCWCLINRAMAYSVHWSTENWMKWYNLFQWKMPRNWQQPWTSLSTKYWLLLRHDMTWRQCKWYCPLSFYHTMLCIVWTMLSQDICLSLRLSVTVKNCMYQNGNLHSFII